MEPTSQQLTLERDLADLRWRDPDGRPTSAPAIRSAAPLSDPADHRGSVWRIETDRGPALLKLRRLRTLRRSIAATLNRSTIDHERTTIAATRAADLPTPTVLASARARRCVLVTRAAILLDFCEGQLLRSLVTRASSDSDHSRLDQIAQSLIDIMARIRKAAFADDDFGLGNLIAIEPPDDHHLTWIDLEAAYHAQPHDTRATGRMLGNALASWWRSDPSQRRLNHLAHLARSALPEPRDGWPATLRLANHRLAERAAKLLRHDRTTSLPDPVQP